MSMIYKGHKYKVLTSEASIDKIDNHLVGVDAIEPSHLFDTFLYENGIGGAGPGGISSTTFLNVEPLSRIYLDAQAIVGMTASATMIDNGYGMTFYPESQWDQTDVKYQITKFVCDTSNTSGHFEDADGNPVSVGPGEVDNEKVRKYVRVILENGTVFYISDISGDGTGDNGVLFRSKDDEEVILATGNYAVAYIYGTEITNIEVEDEDGDTHINSEASLSVFYGAESTEYSPFNDTTDDLSDYSLRVVVPSSTLGVTGNRARITLNSNGKPASFKGCSIGKRAVMVTLDEWQNTSGAAMTNGFTNPWQSTDSDTGPYAIRFSGTAESSSNLSQSYTGLLSGNPINATVRVKALMGQNLRAVWYYDDPMMMGQYYIWNYDTFSYDHSATSPINAGDSYQHVVTPGTIYSTETVPGAVTPIGGALKLLLFSNHVDIFVDNVVVTYDMGNIARNASFDTWTTTPLSSTNGEPVLFTWGEDEEETVELTEENGYTATSNWAYLSLSNTSDNLIIMDIDEAEDTWVDRTGHNEGIYARAMSETRGSSFMGGGESYLPESVSFLSGIEIAAALSPTNETYIILANQPGIIDGMFDLNDQELDVEPPEEFTPSDHQEASAILSFDSGRSWKMWVEPDPESPLPITEGQWFPVVSNKATDHGGTDGNWYYISLLPTPPYYQWVAMPEGAYYNNAPAAMGAFLSETDSDGFMSDDHYAEADLYGIGGYQNDGNLLYGLGLYVEDYLGNPTPPPVVNGFEIDFSANIEVPVEWGFGGWSGGEPPTDIMFVASLKAAVDGIREWVLVNMYDQLLDSLTVYYK